MQISNLPPISGLQTHVPESKERPGPDRDHDADDKSVAPRPVAATPKGLGGIVNRKA